MKKVMRLCLAFAVTLTAAPTVFADMETAETVSSAEELTSAETEAYAEPVSREQVDQMVSDFIANYDGELTEQDLADLEEFRIRRGDEVEQEAAEHMEAAEQQEMQAAAGTEIPPATGELKMQTTLTGYIRIDGRAKADTTYQHGYAILYKETDAGQTELITKQDTGLTGRFEFEIPEEGKYHIVVTDEVSTLARTVKYRAYKTRFENVFEIATENYPIVVWRGDYNQNGTIDQEDVSEIQSNMGRYNITPDSEYARYDIDGNGNVNVVDYMAVQNRLNATASSYSGWMVGDGQGDLMSAEIAEPIEVNVGTAFEDIPFPAEASTVWGYWADKVIVMPVPSWTVLSATNYDPNTEGTYTFYGELDTYYEVEENGEIYTGNYRNKFHVVAVATVIVKKMEPTVECIPQIVAGKDFVLGLAKDGTVYGQGYLINKKIEIDATVVEWNQLQGDERIQTIYASETEMAGLTFDGHVKSAGKLTNTGNNKEIIESWENIVQVSVSKYVIAARDKEGKLFAVSDQTGTTITNGGKIADMITKGWTAKNKIFAVGNKHAVAVDENNYGAGYHVDYITDSSVQPEELNFLSWLNRSYILDLQVGDGYTAGLVSSEPNSKTGKLQVAGKYENGTTFQMPGSIGGYQVQKMRVYGDYVLVLRNGQYFFFDTKTNQSVDTENYYPENDLIGCYHANAVDENDQPTAWSNLVDIACSQNFIIGLCRDGSILCDTSNKNVTEEVVTSWNLGETVG